MKKAYETPTIEKIAFNYRDQVVAASGAGISGQANGSEAWILQGRCGGWGDRLVSAPNDLQLCWNA